MDFSPSKTLGEDARQSRARSLPTSPRINREVYKDPMKSIGSRDLDPLSVTNGGVMIFDPLRSGFSSRIPQPRYGDTGIPFGSIPSGARFDPFLSSRC